MTRPPDARPFGLRILGRVDEPGLTSTRRVLALLAALIVGSNILGVATVYVLGAFVLPGPTPSNATTVALDNLWLGLAWTSVFSAGAMTYGRTYVERNLAWLRTGRSATDAERRAVLRLPALVASFQAIYWLTGAVLFAAFNGTLGDRLAVQIGVTLAMGGLLTSFDCYTVADIICRPLAARVLAGGVPPGLKSPGVRMRALLTWMLSSALPVIGLMLLAGAALVRTGITSTRMAVTVLVFGGVMLAFGARTTLTAARSNSDPVRSLRLALRRVESGDLEVRVPIYDGSEIGQLQAGFNSMAAGLQERERIRALFEHHVGREVAATAMAVTEGESLGGDIRDAGVLFVDIVRSTALAATLEPDEVVSRLNAFFAVVVEVAARHGGLVNKFEGDGALVVFGAPTPLPDPAGAALAAARELRDALAQEAGRFEAGIGVSAGEVVAGNIGAPARYEYTVIGDPVNEAARLTDLAKGWPGRLLASWSAVERAGHEERHCWRRGEEVELRGRPRTTRLAEPVTDHPVPSRFSPELSR